jgi:hypothetical protein
MIGFLMVFRLFPSALAHLASRVDVSTMLHEHINHAQITAFRRPK